MKNKLIALACCMALPFSAAACNSVNLQSSSTLASSNASSAIMQESSSTSFALAGESSQAVSSTLTPSSQSKSLESIGGNSSAQQAVFKQIKEALNTKVPLMLPTGIPMEQNRYLTATTVSHTSNYKVNFYKTNRSAKINSTAASKGMIIASVEGTTYKDDASAQKSISDYAQINSASSDEFIDLGHQIKAAERAGLGHQQLLWNEGRWYIDLDYPTDSSFQTKDYPDSKQLAKNVAAYLDKSMLPVPHKIGTVRIINWKKSAETTIQWQNNQTVYQISSEDPITALKVAVAMKSGSKNEPSSSGWVAYIDENQNLHVKRKDGKDDKMIVKDVAEAPCVAGDWVYYLPDLDEIDKVKLDGSQKTKVCSTDALVVYNANVKKYHEINGSSSVTAEYKDGYILYKCFQMRQVDDKKINPPSYYKLDLKQNKLIPVKN